MLTTKDLGVAPWLLLCFFATAHEANAMPTPVVPMPTGSASLNDVMIIDPLNGGNATAADGAFSGNDTGAQGTALLVLNDNPNFTGTDLDWVLGGKSDDPGNGPFTSNPNTTTGDLMFDSPINTAFAVSLKSGTQGYSLYYFENALAEEILKLKYDTVGVGNQALSHATLFLPTNGTPPPPPPPASSAIPEPTTAALGLMGVAGLLACRRRVA